MKIIEKPIDKSTTTIKACYNLIPKLYQNYRGKKISTLLMREIEKRAKLLGANMIRLDTFNWRIVNRLKVKENQQLFVPFNIGILTRAFAYREHNSRVYRIYKGEQPIGLLMQRDYKEDNRLLCVLEEFMIAE